MRAVMQSITSALLKRLRLMPAPRTRRETEEQVFLECYWPSIRYLVKHELFTHDRGLGRIDSILASARRGAMHALDEGADAPHAADIARMIVMMETTP